MKNKAELIRDLLATLTELRMTIPEKDLEVYLLHRLQFLAETLGDDIPEYYREEVEDLCVLW